MPRVSTNVARLRRKNQILKQAKGYFGRRKNLYKTAKEAVERAHRYAYRDRKNRKRDFRRLWIIRINAAARLHDLSYSRFMNGLRLAAWRSTARCWRTSPFVTRTHLVSSPKPRAPSSHNRSGTHCQRRRGEHCPGAASRFRGSQTPARCTDCRS